MIKNCTHIKADGTRCGSPALRGRDQCYFHFDHRRRTHRAAAQGALRDLPPLEDLPSVQLALMDVADAILHDRIDARRASQLLWALQIASSNCRQFLFDVSPDEMARELPANYPLDPAPAPSSASAPLVLAPAKHKA